MPTAISYACRLCQMHNNVDLVVMMARGTEDNSDHAYMTRGWFIDRGKLTLQFHNQLDALDVKVLTNIMKTI